MSLPCLTFARWSEAASTLLQTQVAVPAWLLLLVPAALLAIWLAIRHRHQKSLAAKAWLTSEALRNEDYQFRLSCRGLPAGERALMDALNNMGQEIGNLMNKHEVESWKKLTRVLTHEIMNSIAPVSCITQAWLNDPQVKGSPYEEGLRAIGETTASLAAFVESYRKMSQLQEPVPREVSLAEAASSLQAMYPQVTWQVQLAGAPTVWTDPHLLHQILANLARNAIEAGAHRIGLHWRDALLVSNDGQPIPTDVRREIFIPFFTTKHTGNGIGLSFSRQIMATQGGDLCLLAVPVSGYHTTFALSFPRKGVLP